NSFSRGHILPRFTESTSPLVRNKPDRILFSFSSYSLYGTKWKRSSSGPISIVMNRTLSPATAEQRLVARSLPLRIRSRRSPEAKRTGRCLSTLETLQETGRPVPIQRQWSHPASRTRQAPEAFPDVYREKRGSTEPVVGKHW